MQLATFFLSFCLTVASKLAACPTSKFIQLFNNVLHDGASNRHSYGTCLPVHSDEFTPDNLLALCPWDLVPDFDEFRHPQTILVARCRCRTCLQSLKCKPVYVQKEVMQYQCLNGTMTWTRSYQYFPNSCVCTRLPQRYVKKSWL